MTMPLHFSILSNDTLVEETAAKQVITYIKEQTMAVKAENEVVVKEKEHDEEENLNMRDFNFDEQNVALKLEYVNIQDYMDIEEEKVNVKEKEYDPAGTHIAENLHIFDEESKNSHLTTIPDNKMDNHLKTITPSNDYELKLDGKKRPGPYLVIDASNSEITNIVHIKSYTANKPGSEKNIFKLNKPNISDDTSAGDSLEKIFLQRYTAEKIHSCDMCNYESSRYDFLRTHKKIHKKERRFSCDICNYKTSQKYQLSIHIRKHLGEKPYSCDMCNYQCSQVSSLSRHVRGHSGEKPFSCNVCNYKCLHYGDLIKHKSKPGKN